MPQRLRTGYTVENTPYQDAIIFLLHMLFEQLVRDHVSVCVLFNITEMDCHVNAAFWFIECDCRGS